MGTYVSSQVSAIEVVVDELGCLPLEKQTANLFFQLVSRRYERGSMLITTNQAEKWGAWLLARR